MAGGRSGSGTESGAKRCTLIDVDGATVSISVDVHAGTEWGLYGLMGAIMEFERILWPLSLRSHAFLALFHALPSRGRRSKHPRLIRGKRGNRKH